MNPVSGGLDPQVIPVSEDHVFLWDWVNRHIESECGIKGIFYLCYPVGDSGGTPATLIHRAIWKTSYPEDYINALPGNPLTNDYSANHVLETGKVSRWHDPDSPSRMTPGERKRIEIDEQFNMAVGACFPIFTRNHRICGGFGLRSKSQDAAQFDAMLQARHHDLATFLIGFDERFRGPYARSVFKLSPQEVRVLAYLAGGMAVARLSHEMGLSAKTVEAYMASARRKTTSATTAETVAKAIFFGLL